jgi:hypothetical protein
MNTSSNGADQASRDNKSRRGSCRDWDKNNWCSRLAKYAHPTPSVQSKLYTVYAAGHQLADAMILNHPRREGGIGASDSLGVVTGIV